MHCMHRLFWRCRFLYKKRFSIELLLSSIGFLKEPNKIVRNFLMLRFLAWQSKSCNQTFIKPASKLLTTLGLSNWKKIQSHSENFEHRFWSDSGQILVNWWLLAMPYRVCSTEMFSTCFLLFCSSRSGRISEDLGKVTEGRPRNLPFRWNFSMKTLHWIARNFQPQCLSVQGELLSWRKPLEC